MTIVLYLLHGTWRELNLFLLWGISVSFLFIPIGCCCLVVLRILTFLPFANVLYHWEMASQELSMLLCFICPKTRILESYVRQIIQTLN